MAYAYKTKITLFHCRVPETAEAKYQINISIFKSIFKQTVF